MKNKNTAKEEEKESLDEIEDEDDDEQEMLDEETLLNFDAALNSLLQKTQSMSRSKSSGQQEAALAELSMKLQSDAASLEQDLATVKENNKAEVKTEADADEQDSSAANTEGVANEDSPDAENLQING